MIGSCCLWSCWSSAVSVSLVPLESPEMNDPKAEHFLDDEEIHSGSMMEYP